MATRFYFGNGTPPVSPAFDAAWESTASAIRRVLERFKSDNLSVDDYVSIAYSHTTGPQDKLMVQYTSAQLNGNQTISGAIGGQMRAMENNSGADLRTQMVVWVMKTDGTSRGTLIAEDTSALSNEWNGSLRNIYIPKGGAVTPTSVAALDTDRIVVEIGFRKHEVANSRTGTIEMGNPTGTDLPVNETQTTQGVPWIEFADTLTFYDDLGYIRSTQMPVEVLMSPDNAMVRLTQMPIEVIYPTNSIGATPKPRSIVQSIIA